MFGILGAGHLNPDSMWRIRNIETGFRNYPPFSSYQIRSYLYDMSAGCHAIEITSNGRLESIPVLSRCRWEWKDWFYRAVRSSSASPL